MVVILGCCSEHSHIHWLQPLVGSGLSGIDLVCSGSAWVSEIIDLLWTWTFFSSEDIAVAWNGMELATVKVTAIWLKTTAFITTLVHTMHSVLMLAVLLQVPCRLDVWSSEMQVLLQLQFPDDDSVVFTHCFRASLHESACNMECSSSTSSLRSSYSSHSFHVTVTETRWISYQPLLSWSQDTWKWSRGSTISCLERYSQPFS